MEKSVVRSKLGSKFISLFLAAMYFSSVLMSAVIFAGSVAASPQAHQEAWRHCDNSTALCKNGNYQEAIRELRLASAVEPEWKLPYMKLGRIYDELHMSGEAWTAYRKVISIDADDAEAWCFVASAYNKSGDKETAIKTYRKVLRKFPLMTRLHKNIADILREQGKIQEAYDEIRKAPLDKSDPSGCLTLALITYDRGDKLSALNVCDESLKLHPQDKSLLDLRNRCNDELNSPAAAKSAAAALPPATNVSSISAATAALGAAGSSSPAQEAELAGLPNEDSISFRKSGSGRLMVDAQVNGRSVEMMFDTGANVCMIGENHLKSMGIDVPALKGRSSVLGGSGGGFVKVMVVPMTLKLGKTSRTVDMYVQTKMPTDPLVGQDFLRGYQFEVNNQLQVLKLKKKVTGTGSTVAAQERVDPRDRNAVSFAMLGKNIVVPVEVCGKEVSMIFDTGAQGIVFPAAVWQSLHLNAKLLGVGRSGGIDGSTTTLYYTVDRIDFGPVSLKNVQVGVSNPGPMLPLLGQSVLGGEKFIIDESAKAIRFHR